MKRGDLVGWHYLYGGGPVTWNERVWVDRRDSAAVGGPCVLVEWNDDVLTWINWAGTWSIRSPSTSRGQRITYYTTNKVAVVFRRMVTA
jgi:hypothetical protein